jgi:hypothetical protein
VSGSERGSFEWAFAVLASTFASGTPARIVTPVDIEEAAVVMVAAFVEQGYRHVPTSSRVWDLMALRPGEALDFAQGRVNWLLDELGLEPAWRRDERGGL